MKQRVLLFLIALCIAIPLRSQDLSSATWYFGVGGGLSFTSGAPVPITGGQTNLTEGTSVICDPVTGAAIAYTDGNTVWRGDHSVAATGVGGRVYSSTMGGLFVRHPSDSTIIYLFTVEDSDGALADARVITCSYVGGLFSVGATRTIASGVTEKVTASRACDGIDYWVVLKLRNGTFSSFKVSATNGFELASRINSPVGLVVNGAHEQRGEMKISPDGRWLAVANETVGTELCSFNNATGVITSVEQFDLGQQRYGVSFSPNSQLLYVNSGWRQQATNILYQFDLSRSPVSSSKLNVGTFDNVGPGCMMIAPDGRIYVARFLGSALGAIRSPNVRGVGCDFNDTEIPYSPGVVKWGLPNVPQNFFVPQFTGKNDTNACENSSLRLGIAPLPGYTYQWSPGTRFNDSTSAQPTVIVNGAQRYRLIVTDPNGCKINQVVDVTSRPQPPVGISSDTTICYGTTATLRANRPVGGQLQWGPGESLSSISLPTTIARPVVTTQYFATVRDASGCENVDTVTVTVHVPAKPVLASTPSIDLCQGLSQQLTVGNMQGSILWSTGETTPSITVTTGGEFWVAVTDSMNCVGRDTVTIISLPRPSASATGSTEICAGESAPMQASGGVSYLWSPSVGLNDPTSATPIASPTQTTRYDVEVTGANGCKDTASVTITVRAIPIPLLNYGDTTICGCDSLILSAPPGYASYLWSDGSTTESIIVDTAGSFSVFVTDDLGCTSTSAVVRIDTFTTRTNVSTIIVPYAAPDGTRVNLEIIVNNWLALAPCFGDSISWIVEMQTGVLAPVNDLGRGVLTDSGKRILRGVTRWDGVTNDVVTKIPYIVTIGDTNLTNVWVRSIQGARCPGTLTGNTASFGVEDICRAAGIIRKFISPARFTGILAADPNPANDAVTIRLRMDNQQSYHLEFRDVLGQVVMQTTPTSGGPGVVSVPIDVGGLAPGKYIITLVAGSERSGYLLEVL